MVDLTHVKKIVRVLSGFRVSLDFLQFARWMPGALWLKIEIEPEANKMRVTLSRVRRINYARRTLSVDYRIKLPELVQIGVVQGVYIIIEVTKQSTNEIEIEITPLTVLPPSQ
jgi:hypothetical protein